MESRGARRLARRNRIGSGTNMKTIPIQCSCTINRSTGFAAEYCAGVNCKIGKWDEYRETVMIYLPRDKQGKLVEPADWSAIVDDFVRGLTAKQSARDWVSSIEA